MSKTTSDGICADCWGSKGGRPMFLRQPQTSSLFDDSFDDISFFLFGGR
jgi:hypothetical protein